MQYKFFNTGQLCKLLISLCIAATAHAQLDWSTYVVVFGTDQDEAFPQLVKTEEGRFRALCVRDDFSIRSRRSMLHGNAWESYADFTGQGSPIRLTAASDTSFSYLLKYELGASVVDFFRIDHSVNSYPEPVVISINQNNSLLEVNAFTDVSFSMSDSYLFLNYVFRDSLDVPHVGMMRSPNYGVVFTDTVEVATGLLMQDSSAHVSQAVTWNGDNERIWIAVTMDRPGTTGEQIVLLNSDDMGATWSEQITPDSSSYAQMRATLVGREGLIMLAYQRRNSTSLARDIYVTYSPDNGESWSEPLQLTDHAFDDTRPELEISGDYVGLFYTRSPVQQNTGDLLFRQVPLNQPWTWEPEVVVSGESEFAVSDGYSSASDEDGFAAIWTGRLVGDDGDVFFNSSWRGTAVNEPGRSLAPRPIFTQDRSTGRIEYEIPTGVPVTATFYDVLGRRISQSVLTGSRGYVNLPEGVPTGTYWLSSDQSSAIRIQIVR